MTHPRTGYIRPRAALTPEQLMADIGSRLERGYSVRYQDPAVNDLVALLELCQQQRLVIEQWEAVCQMHCRGAEGIAEIVRSMDDCTSVGQEQDIMP